MDRSLMKLLVLGLLVTLILLFLAFFAMAPIFCSSVGSLLYTLFYFILNESHEVHSAQEFENRFWTIFAVLLSTAIIFAKDSPLAFGLTYPSTGFIGVLLSGYGMHVWDRNMHRMEIGKLVNLRRGTTAKSLDKLRDMGIPIEDQLARINTLLNDLDQFYIPSTLNNILNKAEVVRKEREIISIFEEAEKKALNFLIASCRLALLFYKIKDHRSFNQQHRSQLIELLALERVSDLTVHSRVIVLHALQIIKFPSNTRAEYCVKNIIINTRQDDLSDLKTLTDAKGDYFCMTKLIFDDIKSSIVRDNILHHIEVQARVQINHMLFNTKRSRAKRKNKFWRKVLSDVDDTLTCSAGSYPSGIDKRYGKKIVYPGVLGFYRELDLGIDGPEEWPMHTVGNLVFLSARPHVFKDMTEKINYAKFQKLQAMRGMHTMPTLLAGDINSGLETMIKNDYEPLAQKKFDNFRKYVAIYPEFKHVFICDNGQGDVRAAELMVEAFPKHIEAIYVHVVQKISQSYKYRPENWANKEIRPFFFTTYPEAALDAAKRNFIRPSGLRRICIDSINDFYLIQTKDWPSEKHKLDRREELNQALWSCNKFLKANDVEEVSLLDAERLWKDGQKVNTPFGNGVIVSFEKVHDLYGILLDWTPIDEQIKNYENDKASKANVKKEIKAAASGKGTPAADRASSGLETVFESEPEERKDSQEDSTNGERKDSSGSNSDSIDPTSTPNLEMESDSSEVDETEDFQPKCQHNHVVAKVQGRYISKYKPPTLPTFPSDKTVFSFWGSRGETSQSNKNKAKAKPVFAEGDKCSTPYGTGVVLSHRQDDGIVVLKMTGWSATCYLSVNIVKNEGEGFFGSLFRKININSPEPQKQGKSMSPRENGRELIKDCVVATPFGEGRVTRVNDACRSSDSNTTNKKKGREYETIGISITAWTLANGTHPTVYCTEETALHWKTNGRETFHKNSSGIFSALDSIVSLGKKLITKKTPTEIVVAQSYERFYKDGAAVVTPYGNGRVQNFREPDGFYEVRLVEWKLANSECPKLYVRKESLTYQKASGCHEGHAVLTSYGLSGILQSVQQETGIHIVTIPNAGMVCYLQPEEIIRPVKAVVGDDVLTPYGNGKLIRYRCDDNLYEILLVWGATLYAQAEAFHRDSNFEDRKGLNLNMGWVFRLFFTKDTDTSITSQRSRSNSITSMRSQSSRGLLP